MATQNPIEQEGTYPLPEAQLDRFMFMVLVNYPTEVEEFDIVRLTTENRKVRVGSCALRGGCARLAGTGAQGARGGSRGQVRDPAGAADAAGAAGHAEVHQGLRELGAGPRASQTLVLAGKARALLAGRYHVRRRISGPWPIRRLRHRVLTNFNAEAEGIKSNDIIRMLIEQTPRDAEDEKTAAACPKCSPRRKHGATKTRRTRRPTKSQGRIEWPNGFKKSRWHMGTCWTPRPSGLPDRSWTRVPRCIQRFGPGLIESVYVQCLIMELEARGLNVQREVMSPLFIEAKRSSPALGWIYWWREDHH